jgi:hypothetical protein
MNTKSMWCTLLTVLLTVTVIPLRAVTKEVVKALQAEYEHRAATLKAVTRNGLPAVECDYGGGYVWSIWRVDLNGKPAFEIPVRQARFPGAVLVTAERIAYEGGPAKSAASFDEARRGVTWTPLTASDSGMMELDVVGRKYRFFGQSSEGSNPIVPGYAGACATFVNLAFSDFAAADRQFHRLTRNLPSIQDAAWRDFHPKAAAWRALTTKPPLSPEAKRERILAENAISELGTDLREAVAHGRGIEGLPEGEKKHLDSAVEHYESALEIQSTWPDGWFNLAMIYAAQNNYTDALDAMKHYLELVPDAPDAQAAREQMIIWEDKARH